MGILAGVIDFSGIKDSDRALVSSMLSVQKHRDGSAQSIQTGAFFVIGMVNRFDALSATAPDPVPVHGVYAAMDGILLEPGRHVKALGGKTGVEIHRRSSIIAASYRTDPREFMKDLEGEFSCVIADTEERSVLLVRDPIGHKPMHYCRHGSRVYFSSEIKGLLAAGIPREMDMGALNDFLTLNCVPCPSTIFKGVFQVPPGSMSVFTKDARKEIAYWQLTREVMASVDEHEAVDRFTSLFSSAVRKRMVSDTTYCFLSGGIDSSAVVSFAAEAAAKPIQTITVGFSEKDYDESAVAAEMARHVGSEHHHVIARPDDFLSMLEMLVGHHDSPFTDTSAYPTYYAAKLARGMTDLILTGDGPDQLLGGSTHHIAAVRNDIFRAKNPVKRNSAALLAALLEPLVGYPRPSPMVKIYRKLSKTSLAPVRAEYEYRAYFPEIVKRFMVTDALWDIHSRNNPYRHPERWFAEAGDVDHVNKYLYADLKFYVTDDLMIKLDRMCMANGLETLSPFQDIRLADYALRLPGQMKVHAADGAITTKYIIRRACEKRFPKTIMEKRKQGFGIPVDAWLRVNNGAFIKSVLLDARTKNRGIFKPRSLERFVDDFLNGRRDYFYANAYSLVSLLTLELWHRRYFDGDKK